MPKPKPKPKPGKGTKILCATLDFIINVNVETAAEEAEKGNTKGANDALDVAIAAGKDYQKWGCGRAARVRKRIAMLSREMKRGRRSARSGR